MAKLGFEVIVHGRNKEKAEAVLSDIKNKTNQNNLTAVYADLVSFTQIIEMADTIYERFNKLDILINNAGVLRPNHYITKEGLEETFTVNYVAPFLLTNLLIKLLKKESSSRIVNVASRVHSNHIDFDNLQFEKGYSGVKAYAQSKTCLIMFTYFLAEKLKDTNITLNCLHPGVINTKLLRAAYGSFGASPSEGAKALIYASTSPELEKISGKYLKDNTITSSKDITYNKELQKKLWKKTEDIIGIKFENF